MFLCSDIVNLKNQMKKLILITGAGTGIGRDAAYALAARGHHVVAATYTQEQADALREESTTKGCPLQTMKLDITNATDRDQVLELQPDVLINNAAIGESGSLAEVDVARIRNTFEVNVFATLELTQLALRSMIARQSGTVIFISSIAGRIPMPFLMPYSMTKFALSAAAAGLREEMDQLGRNIQIAVVEPGAIHTGFNQSMTDRKYTWMQQDSYFSEQTGKMQKQEARVFGLLEAKSTKSVVAKIVKASEARRPRLRYVAPWIQGLGVRLARIFGV